MLSLGFELICYRFVYKDWQSEIRHSHYYTFNISSTVSAIITTPMPYQFHITNSFTTDDTPQSNQFNFLISSNVSLLQYIIHMFLLPFHFFSTASTIQSSIHPISSILSLHQCSLSSFHPLLTLSPPSLYSLTNNCYSINPYLLYASHITSPSSYLPYTQFSYTLHHIFPSVTTIFPSTTSTIPYSMLLFPTTHMSRTLSLLSPALHHHNSRITPTPLLHCTLASMMFLPLS